MPTMQSKRVGLALGGGVVRGSAHIGVLLALEEAGISIDMISGTSAGSIVATCYAAGMSSRVLKELAMQLTWRQLLRPVWPLRGLFSFQGLHRLLTSYLGALRFEDLKLPCAVAVTDVKTGLARYISTGPVFLAVQASCSVPGIIAPVLLDGRLACEGGVADMLPSAILHQMGADYVIGVDVFLPKLRRWLGPAGYLLSATEAALEHAGGGVDQVDCLIAPQLAGRPYVRFSLIREFCALGHSAAWEKAPEILRALERTAADGRPTTDS